MHIANRDSFVGRSLRRFTIATLFVGGALTAITAAHGATLEQLCTKDRYDAAARYSQCHLKTFGKLFGGTEAGKVATLLSKCRLKYGATWTKLQAKWLGTATTCDGTRFIVAGGLVFDNLTGLEWEQKTDDGGIHDTDDVYTWGGAGTAATVFLRQLNDDCFAGQCDWRLPTLGELQTILLPEPYPCTTNPCIDEAVFGPTASNIYWSSTKNGGSAFVWEVNFANGSPGAAPESLPLYVRAVRGGL